MNFLFSFSFSSHRSWHSTTTFTGTRKKTVFKICCCVLTGDLKCPPSPPQKMKRNDVLMYCLSASLKVLLARRWKDNLISIPWDSANRHTVHQTHWWGWAKFECHCSEKHPILIIQVGKGDSFRWSAHLLVHLPGFTLPFTSRIVQPRKTVAVREMFSCITQALVFAQFLSGAVHTRVTIQWHNLQSFQWCFNAVSPIPPLPARTKPWRQQRRSPCSLQLPMMVRRQWHWPEMSKEKWGIKRTRYITVALTCPT